MLYKIIFILSLTIITGPAQAQNRVACIDQDEVIGRMPEVAVANRILRQFQDSLQQDFQQQQDAYNQKVNQWIKTCGDLLTPVPDSTKAKRRQEAIDQTLKLSEFNNTVQQLITKRAAELFNPILNKFKTELKKITDENGYTYVIDLCAENTLPFPLPPSTDITALVIAKWGL
jgi:outer membrane protein